LICFGTCSFEWTKRLIVTRVHDRSGPQRLPGEPPVAKSELVVHIQRPEIEGVHTRLAVVKQGLSSVIEPILPVAGSLPLPEPASQGPAIGEVLALLTGVGKESQERAGTGPA
jgi:hypothetical protein